MRLTKVPWDHPDLLQLQRTILPGDDPRVSSKDLWWIAYMDKTPAGFCALADMGQRVWYLSRAGVMPFARGHGLQRRMIYLRDKAVRAAGGSWVVTDTHKDNWACINNLVSCGYRAFRPRHSWALPESTYWRKRVAP